VHRGHVVNLSRVKGFKRYDDRRMLVNLEDGTRIVASRAGSKALRSMIE
ncbi:MAG: LytTR family transcriptional regulator, partial [Gemmatimonadetes bacterium]|nr:LytTR family transcriptional regulator [Gemmatimonadota bacterium]